MPSCVACELVARERAVATSPYTMSHSSFSGQWDGALLQSKQQNQLQSKAEPEPDIFLYLDYNGVLNSGQRDMLAAMCEFLFGLDHLDRNMHISLLSKGRKSPGNTLRQLDHAGVLDLFDRITFTTARTSREHRGKTAIEHHIYQPDRNWPIVHSVTNYEVFHGGKDQYIHSHHGHRSSGCILFVDDKAETLEATRVFMPFVSAIEMRRHRFYTDRRIYHHVRNLEELYDAISRLTTPHS